MARERRSAARERQRLARGYRRWPPPPASRCAAAELAASGCTRHELVGTHALKIFALEVDPSTGGGGQTLAVFERSRRHDAGNSRCGLVDVGKRQRRAHGGIVDSVTGPCCHPSRGVSAPGQALDSTNNGISRSCSPDIRHRWGRPQRRAATTLPSRRRLLHAAIMSHLSVPSRSSTWGLATTL